MKPHITEKSYSLAGRSIPSFTFLVDKTETVASIKAKVKEIYNQDVIEVRFLSLPGKKVRRRNIAGSTSSKRKAIITLKKGQNIKDFDLKTEEKEKKEPKPKKETKKDGK